MGLFALVLSMIAAGTCLAAQAAPLSGLDFPSNGQTYADIRFHFTGAALQPMYPATYIWRVKLRQQSGYYTTFFWGPDGGFTGTSYYGCHPYPDGDSKADSRAHKWELSIYGNDYVDDANGNSTQLGYDTWKTQAFRAFDNGTNKVHEYYWDLPDTTKVIRVLLGRDYGPPPNPALTFGDAPWKVGNERLSGILRGIQTYSASLSVKDILAEAASPRATAAGEASLWYLNLDPRPEDIADKSGKGHDPGWVSATRAGAWLDGLSTEVRLAPPLDRERIRLLPEAVTALGRVRRVSDRPTLILYR
jgi:hypothetical protein